MPMWLAPPARWPSLRGRAVRETQLLQAVRTGGRPDDPLAAQLPDGPYALGPNATKVFGELGVDLDDQPSRRQLLRFCVDWSEQRHHLSGQLGASIVNSFLANNWLHRRPNQRAVDLTDAGHESLAGPLGG
jgi:hypothetical protein